MRQAASYPRSGVVCKTGIESRLQPLFSKASGCQVAGRARPWATPIDDSPGATDLRFEALQDLGNHLPGNSLTLQVVADCRISIASPGQCLCPVRGEAAVVHDAGGFQHRE
jgi:hypothetical protein